MCKSVSVNPTVTMCVGRDLGETSDVSFRHNLIFDQESGSRALKARSASNKLYFGKTGEHSKSHLALVVGLKP